MAQLIVRKLDDDVKERLRMRAKRHGRTLEAEARVILERAATGGRRQTKPALNTKVRKTGPKRPLKKERGLGTLMYERFRKTGLTEEEARLFQQGIDEINGRSGRRASNFGE